ncbi:MAG TPA: nuclear transport factor 2 family protein [Rhizomicrobium sp.]
MATKTLAALSVLLFVSAAQAQQAGLYNDVPPDLAKAALAYDSAQVHGDGAALKRLLADDYRLVNGGAHVEDKAQFIADSTDPKFQLQPFTVAEPVHTVWEKGAVLGGLVDDRWIQDGKPGEQTFRFSDIWAKRGNGWVVVYTQVTRVPPKS